MCMRKVTAALALAFLLALPCGGATLSLYSGGGLYYRDEVLRFDSRSMEASLSTGPLRLGSIDEDLVDLALSGQQAPWPGRLASDELDVSGAALVLDEAAVFLLSSPRPLLGLSLKPGRFALSLAYGGRTSWEEGLMKEHTSRHGPAAFAMALGWLGEHLLARGRFSWVDEVGMMFQLSLGAAWQGLGLVWTRGGEADLAVLDEAVEDEYVVFLDTAPFSFTLSRTLHDKAVRPGTYRVKEGRVSVRLALGRLRLSSSMTSSFSAKGVWEDEVSFLLGYRGIMLGWDSVDGFSISLGRDGIRFHWEDGVYALSARFDGRMGHVRVRLESDGSAEAVLTLYL